MYTLIDLKNESQAEYLNSALRRHGLNSFILNTGIAPDGVKMFSITCHNASDLKRARHLIYTSSYFLSDMHPEAAMTIRELRRQNRSIFLEALTSKPAFIISSLAMVAALIGYIFDL